MMSEENKIILIKIITLLPFICALVLLIEFFKYGTPDIKTIIGMVFAFFLISQGIGGIIFGRIITSTRHGIIEFTKGEWARIMGFVYIMIGIILIGQLL